MCQHSNFDFDGIYDINNNILNIVDALPMSDLKDIKNGFDAFSTYIQALAGTNTSRTLFDYMFTRSIYEDLRRNSLITEFGTSKNNRAYKSINDNLWNFSVAKQFHFIQNLNIIKSSTPDLIGQRVNALSKLVFIDQQAVEQKQVARVTQVANTAIGGGKWLMYVTENDSKVREAHRKANGTKLPSEDPFWQDVACKLLSNYNCRCSIIEVFDVKKGDAYHPGHIDVMEEPTPSNIDIQTGQVQVFKEELPIFSTISNSNVEVLRKYYKGKMGGK